MTANSPTYQEKRAQSPGTAGCNWEMWVQKVVGLGQDLEANTEFRHSAFSRVVSAAWPLEVREGIEGTTHQKQT